MIEATFYPDEVRLTVKGHAGVASKGTDIVCAAASILAHTAAENARILEAQGALLEMSVRLDEGDVEILCVPCKQTEAVVELVFRAVCVGFQLLGQSCPEAVNFSQVAKKLPDRV